MKLKAIAMAAVIWGLGATLQAQTAPITSGTATAKPAAAPVVKCAPQRWDAMLAGFWFDVPTSITNANVRGLKLGLPISSGNGKVIGMEWSLGCGATNYISGFQWSFGVAKPVTMKGFQMAMVNMAEEELHGAQLGLVNVSPANGVQIGIVNSADNAECQLGIVNLNKNGWCPFMLFFNMSK